VNTVAGLLLAAGAGRRMGIPKGLVRDADGESWAARSTRLLAEGGASPLLVVVGARGDEVSGEVASCATVVHAHGWEEGMGASLRAGLTALAAAAAPGVVAVVVGLVDTPGVGAPVVARLIEYAVAQGSSALARAAYLGVPGHPVVLGRDHWPAVIDTARGDAGARTYLAGRDVVRLECGDVGDGRDVDA
jgi:CTP:molybdopterin cytidylyltransferase MocA